MLLAAALVFEDKLILLPSPVTNFKISSTINLKHAQQEAQLKMEYRCVNFG